MKIFCCYDLKFFCFCDEQKDRKISSQAMEIIELNGRLDKITVIKKEIQDEARSDLLFMNKALSVRLFDLRKKYSDMISFYEDELNKQNKKK